MLVAVARNTLRGEVRLLTDFLGQRTGRRWAAGVSVCAILACAACSGGTSAATSGGGGGGRGGGRGGRGGRGGDGGPVPVVTTAVGQKDVPIDIAAIGNVEAYETISVRSQVTGQLNEVLFREGDFVKKGAHLFTIDPRAYQPQLEQAQANLKRDE